MVSGDISRLATDKIGTSVDQLTTVLVQVRTGRAHTGLIDLLRVYYDATEILAQNWGQELSSEQFRTYITRIRKKLAPLGLPMQIVNQPSVGYCMLLGEG